jgi:carboxyl-terminal processing protease
MKYIVASLLAIVVLIASPATAEDQPIVTDRSKVEYKDIQQLANALSVLNFLSMDNRDSKVFVYSALEAMTGTLDRYSFFVPPDLVGLFTQSLKDRYIGIGVYVAKSGNGAIEILSTEPDSPAANAGIKPKDVIVSIDGQPVSKMPFTVALNEISGLEFPEGSTIELSILRGGSPEPGSYVLTRAFIKPSTITWKVLEKGYGYVRISRFKSQALADFRQSVNDIMGQNGNLKGLIIDLRNNHGGDMDACIEILRLFLASCDITVLDSNVPKFRVKFKANNEKIYSWPLTVLVDEGSASASELFAGVLQFHGRATIIGGRTFGKGSFQSLIPIAEGGGLYVTLGKFHLPDGKSIEGIGVTPDVFVGKDATEELLIQKALDVLKYKSKMEEDL